MFIMLLFDQQKEVMSLPLSRRGAKSNLLPFARRMNLLSLSQSRKFWEPCSEKKSILNKFILHFITFDKQSILIHDYIKKHKHRRQ